MTMSSKLSDQLARIRWHCHRGMLELDLILLRFFDTYYANLDPNLQQQFQQLLEQPDPDLLAWLMGHETTSDPNLTPIIDRIRHDCLPHTH